MMQALSRFIVVALTLSTFWQTAFAQSIDLELTKTTDVNCAKVGDIATYTLTLTNEGDSTATGVQVLDLLPLGVTYFAANASTGSYNDLSGIWNVGNVSAMATATLQILVIMDTPNPELSNTAEVVAADQLDIDSTPNNNVPTEDDQDSATIQVVTEWIDLELSVAVDTACVYIGDIVTFSITISNTGADSATDVAVTDHLPAGLTYVSHNTTQGTYSNTTGIWTLGTINGGESATLEIAAVVVSPTSITNIAQVVSATPCDIDSTPNNDDGDQSEDDEGSVMIIGKVIDLALTKTADTTCAKVGDIVTYTLSLTNEGNGDATGVQVLDLLPLGVTYFASNPSTGSYNDLSGIWNVGNVSAMATATLQILVIMDTPNPELINTAEVVAADQFELDSTPNNNVPDEDDQDSTMVKVLDALIDLELSMTATPECANVGDNVTFTITIFNAGPDDVAWAQVTDQLPAGLTFVSSTTSQGTYNSGTGIWYVNNLAMGDSETLEIVATINTTSFPITNIAEVSFAPPTDIDSTPNNGAVEEDDYAAVTVTAKQIDLELTKTVDQACVNWGDQVNFTITLFNAGPSNATGVAVTDHLPAGLDYIHATTSSGTYNITTGIWSIGSLAFGASETLTITVQVSSAGVFENIAQVSAADQPDLDSTPNNDIESEDDQDSATVTGKAIDLELSKTVDQECVNVGDNVTFTITLFNAGPSNATGVAVTDELPAGLTYESATATAGFYLGTTGIWNIGTLEVGQTAELNITVEVTTLDITTNTAQVTAADQPDLDSTPNNDIESEDDQDSATVTVKMIDLELTKTVDQACVNVGDDVIFTLTISNNGSGDATGVTVAYQLPAGLIFGNGTPSTGSYNFVTGIWTIGGIPVGATHTLDIIATVDTTGIFTNVAEVETADQCDIDSTPNNNQPTEDDQDSVTVIASNETIDLELSQSIFGDCFHIGENINFTITITNNGPDNATGVQVTDQLPAGLTFVSSSTSKGTYNAGTGIWNIGNLGVGQTVTLDIVATLTSPSSFTNTAQVTAADQCDIDSTPANDAADEDDMASTIVNVVSHYLFWSVATDVSSAYLGDTVLFTINLLNDYGGLATDIQFSFPLGENFTFLTADGNYDPILEIWTIDELAAMETAQLTIQAIADVVGVASFQTAILSEHDCEQENFSFEILSEPIGIEGTLFLKNNIRLYPNPVTDVLCLDGLPLDATVALLLYNAAGKKVLQKTSLGSLAADLSLGSLPSGIYFLKMVYEGEVSMQKVVKE